MNRFSDIRPAFARNSRWRAAEEWESPDLRVISEMFSSPLSSRTVRTFVLP